MRISQSLLAPVKVGADLLEQVPQDGCWIVLFYDDPNQQGLEHKLARQSGSLDFEHRLCEGFHVILVAHADLNGDDLVAFCFTTPMAYE